MEFLRCGVFLLNWILMIYKAFSNQGFLFRETQIVIQLLAAGVLPKEIVRQIVDDDLFDLRAVASRKTISLAVLQRLEGLDLKCVIGLRLEVQRLMVLLLIARQHRLLAETINQLWWLAKVADTISIGGMERFFLVARDSDLTLQQWSDATFRKSVSNVLKYLTEARLIVKVNKDFLVVRPVLLPVEREAIQITFGAWGLRMLGEL
jgi:hypothetical protein